MDRVFLFPIYIPVLSINKRIADERKIGLEYFTNHPQIGRQYIHQPPPPPPPTARIPTDVGDTANSPCWSENGKATIWLVDRGRKAGKHRLLNLRFCIMKYVRRWISYAVCWHIKGSFGRLSNPCSYLGGSGRGICGLAAYSSSVWFETRSVKSVKGSVLPWGHSALVLKWRRPSFVRGHNPSNWFLIEATFNNLAGGAFNCLLNIIVLSRGVCYQWSSACVFVCNQSILII